MRKLVACLGAATLVFAVGSFAHASPPPQTTLKPYVTLILDTSGSMIDAGDGNPTGSGPPSCGGADNKLNHARCAIQNIANSYGDIEFALGRFRNILSGTTTAGTFPTGCCSNGPDATSTGCPDGVACTSNDDMFEMLNGLQDDAGAGTAVWVNDTGNTCTAVGSDPEIWTANSNTPLAGALAGVRRYWEGLQATATTIGAGTTGASETGTTATFKTTAAHRLVPDEPIVIAGVTLAGYNGQFIVNTVPSSTTFTVTGMPSGLANSGGGSVAVEIFAGTPAQGFAPIANDPTNAVFLPAKCNPTPACTADVPVDCCTSQCRPYVTILLTDGQENCSGSTANDNTFPPNNAAALLLTQVGADNYRIETKPIGFGVTPPSVTACGTVGSDGCQIEDIAHAGGALDVPGKLEGFYASDEAGLELAISQIIEGSVRFEVCNGLDDDCDGRIDEDFPTKGNPCNNGLQGVCAVAGDLVCSADGTGLVCSAGAAACASKAPGAACTVANTAGSNEAGTCQGGDCVPTPGVEICNGLDDDCDGKIDEGLTNCGCIPQPEICNGKDDDCDGKIDEDTDVPCGVNVGVCTAGIEACQCTGSGSAEVCGLGACTGKEPCGGATPCVEICNGLDDDCDGVVDGLSQACSTLSNGHPAGSPANNPGDPGQGTPCDAEGTACACHPGTEVCPAGGSGVFGACIGEVGPVPEVCDGIDNDCDGKIDEGFVPARCGACGFTSCVNGVITCAQGSGSAEICNGLDDDCDGSIDEDVPTEGPCTSGTTCGGTLTCVNGGFQCVGGSAVEPESCNCLDDDCDGKVDEDNGNCPVGSTCTNTGVTCECDFPCAGTEFPCPAGKICNATTSLCETDPCFGVTCSPDGSGDAQVCQGGKCVDTCSTVSCGSNSVCVQTTGQCVANNCTNFPAMCGATQRCVDGACVSNPCAGVTCPTNEYCEQGSCYASCAGVSCGSGHRCVLGTCQTNPCGRPCPEGQVCQDTTATCINNPCQFQTCSTGQYCNPDDGMCETDPCNGTACPGSGQVCVGGTCFSPPPVGPDGGVEVHVTAAGGGCDAGDHGTGLALVLGALGLALGGRRRRAAGGAS